MAYNAFTDGKPVGTDTGLDAIDYIRENLMAARDAVVMGAMQGWEYSNTDDSQPATITYKNGAEWLRATLTWGTTGGADGNVTSAVWAYSSDTGATFDTIGTEEITYYASGNVNTVTWS